MIQFSKRKKITTSIEQNDFKAESTPKVHAAEFRDFTVLVVCFIMFAPEQKTIHLVRFVSKNPRSSRRSQRNKLNAFF